MAKYKHNITEIVHSWFDDYTEFSVTFDKNLIVVDIDLENGEIDFKLKEGYRPEHIKALESLQEKIKEVIKVSHNGNI
jgi:hypothetical protein